MISLENRGLAMLNRPTHQVPASQFWQCQTAVNTFDASSFSAMPRVAAHPPAMNLSVHPVRPSLTVSLRLSGFNIPPEANNFIRYDGWRLSGIALFQLNTLASLPSWCIMGDAIKAERKSEDDLYFVPGNLVAGIGKKAGRAKREM